MCSGVDDSDGWSEHRTREGYTYYHNSRSGASQWMEHEEYKGESQELSRDEIQVRYDSRIYTRTHTHTHTHTHTTTTTLGCGNDGHS